MDGKRIAELNDLYGFRMGRYYVGLLSTTKKDRKHYEYFSFEATSKSDAYLKAVKTVFQLGITDIADIEQCIINYYGNK